MTERPWPNKTRLLAAALAFAGLAAPVPAQQPPVDAGEIVVEARPEDALRRFVEALTDPGRTRQLGRWDREICPTVAGIAPAEAAYMERRIGEIAAPLGLLAHPPGCLTSMLILVTDDAAGLAASFARQYPIMLRSDGRSRLQRFVESRRAVRWLAVTDPCEGGCGLTGSRLSLPTHPEFRIMLVIVDAQQIGGVTLGGLSDYAAFVALANPPLNERRPARSIMALFEEPRPAELPSALTEQDQAFLAGLYDSRANAAVQEQRATIVNRMREGDDDAE